VFEETALLAVRQRQRMLAAARELHQRSGLLSPGARQGAGAEEVAWVEDAAFTVWCATSCASVQYASARLERDSRIAREACVFHGLGLDPDFQFDVDRAPLTVGLGVEVRQRLWIAGRTMERAAEGLERFLNG